MDINRNIIKSGAYVLNNNYEKTQLNINEYGYRHSNQLINSLTEHINSIGVSRYSSVWEDGEIRLKKNILSFLDEKHLETGNIILSNSGDINILSIFRLMKNQKGNTMIQFTPTYTQYENIALLEGWKIKNISIYGQKNITSFEELDKGNPLKNNGKYVFFICNPNNPTGTQWDTEVLLRMFNYFEKSFFVIDETYIDFAKIYPNYNNLARVGVPTSMSSYVNKYDNIVIMRSFSKAFGLAGLRLSYLISSKPVIHQLGKLISHKDVIELSKLAGSAVLENISFYRLQIQKMFKDKDTLIRVLRKFNIIYMNSYSNFICIKMKNKGELIYEMFQSENILIKKFDANSKMKNWIRITIQEDIISKVIQIIRENIYLFKTKKHKNGFIDGCFDGYHYGHIVALSYAKENCKILTCATHSDDEIFEHKNKKALFREEDRLFMLKNNIFIDILSENVPYNTSREILKKKNANLFFHGDDGIDKYPLNELNENNLLYIYPRTHFVSSSELKERILFVVENDKSFIENAHNKIPPNDYLLKCYNQVKRIKNNIVKQNAGGVDIVISGNFDLFSRQHVEQITKIKKDNQNCNIIVALDGNRYTPFIFSIGEQKIIVESCKYVNNVIENYTGCVDMYIDISIHEILRGINL